MIKYVGISFLLLISAFFRTCQDIDKQQESIVQEGAEPELLASDFEFTEGPASDREGNVFFTDQPNNRILKWSASDGSINVFMENAGRANGLYFDHQGNLLAAADEDSELWSIDPEKNVKTLIGDFEGKRLNAPNDIWVAPNGGIYFTDPYYQRSYWERNEKEIEEERVYYLDPEEGVLRIAADGLVQPNGIIGTSDGKTLYIADIGNNKTYSYRISEDGSLKDRKLFAESGSGGMTIDNRGNIYLTGNGVTVFNRKGKQIRHIPIEKDWTANITFGGTDQQTLFITAMDAVYTLQMNTRGVRWQ